MTLEESLLRGSIIWGIFIIIFLLLIITGKITFKK